MHIRNHWRSLLTIYIPCPHVGWGTVWPCSKTGPIWSEAERPQENKFCTERPRPTNQKRSHFQQPPDVRRYPQKPFLSLSAIEEVSFVSWTTQYSVPPLLPHSATPQEQFPTEAPPPRPGPAPGGAARAAAGGGGEGVGVGGGWGAVGCRAGAGRGPARRGEES